jgi:hypothetical protein
MRFAIGVVATPRLATRASSSSVNGSKRKLQKAASLVASDAMRIDGKAPTPTASWLATIFQGYIKLQDTRLDFELSKGRGELCGFVGGQQTRNGSRADDAVRFTLE